jgi:DNA-binding NtrC family response regulator
MGIRTDRCRPAEDSRRKRTAPGDVALGDRGPRHLQIVVVDSGSVRRLPLGESAELVIGRAESADLRLSDPTVSREHAKLVVAADSVGIIDLGSRNGTFVNGHPVLETRRLAARDVVRLGGVFLALELGLSSELAAKAATGICHDGEMAPAAEGAVREPPNEQVLQIGEQTAFVASPAMARVFAQVRELLAASDIPVLICGETGTGKSMVASALHYWSARRNGPLVTLNCASIPEPLMESELFGHARGAFTDAHQAKDGLILTASGGTLVLDEIGELSLPAQAKLLRAIETKRILPLGEIRERPVDVRLVATSNRDLRAAAEKGRFREDLLFRLDGVTLRTPALRERIEEVPTLARRLLESACRRLGRTEMRVSPSAMDLLVRSSWPGNVRELDRLMQLVASVCRVPQLEAGHLDEWWTGTHPNERTSAVSMRALGEPGDTRDDSPEKETRSGPHSLRDELREFERSRILAALQAAQGNRRRAAEKLQVPLRSLVRKLRDPGRY